VSVNEYDAAEVKRKTARLVEEAASGAAVVLIHCASLPELKKLYNAINVQRFRQKQGGVVLLHKDETALLVLLEPKSEKRRRRRKKVTEPACPVEAPPEPVGFEWRKPREERAGDIFYFCDGDARGFFVPDGIVPPHCPYCGAEDSFARDGEVPPYLQEFRRQRRVRGENVIAPQEDAHD
jgi:hypothetical protein